MLSSPINAFLFYFIVITICLDADVERCILDNLYLIFLDVFEVLSMLITILYMFKYLNRNVGNKKKKLL